MIKPELYKRTTDILYQAYFNDTLRKRYCAACAVGNIIAANMGFTFCRSGIWNKWEEGTPAWQTVFATNGDGQVVTPKHYIGEAKKQIDSTGYSWTELAKIELAFEKQARGSNLEDIMFNGLVAVLEVLKEIHQVTDQDLLTTNNNRFKEQYERRAVKTVL